MNKIDRDHLLGWAEAYYFMSQYSPRPRFVAPGTYERRMWECLFKWAGWED